MAETWNDPRPVDKTVKKLLRAAGRLDEMARREAAERRKRAEQIECPHCRENVLAHLKGEPL